MRATSDFLRAATALWILLYSPYRVEAGSLAPVGISPGASAGEEGRFAEIGTVCPTFSWTSAGGRGPIQLAVFELTADATTGAERVTAKTGPILDVSLPGGAAAWTPPLERCLERGRSYAWAVRASGEDATGGWSEPNLFRIAAVPSSEELRAALEVLRATGSPRERAGRGSLLSAGPASEELAAAFTPGGPQSALVASPDDVGVTAEPSETTGAVVGVLGLSDSIGEGSAGLVGESKAASGSVAGVAGLSASSGGAAGVFENTPGGDILAGFSNGSLEFRVTGTGTVVAASFIGHGAGFTDVGDIVCPGNGVTSFGCVTGSTEIEAGTITEADLGDNAVGADEIKAGAVGASEIAAGAVTADKIASEAVGASEIAADAVGTSEIKPLSIRSVDIADGAVGNSELAAESVKTEALDGTEAGHFLYEISAGCAGAGDLTFAFDCPSVSCAAGLFNNCSGVCNAVSSQTCSSTRVGLMLDDTMSN